MKNLLTILCASIVLLSSCADSKVIDGVKYRPYGLLNEDICKNDSIRYQISPWAVCSGIVFCEMIIPPIYVFGYNLYEPIGKIDEPLKKGVVR